jgi:molybdate transport system regulatory protein
MNRPAQRLRIRVRLAKDAPFGPGKADLLDAIRGTGSMAAAGRHLGMSYQRTHDLVAAMNAQFVEPVVAPAKGGSRGGGSALRGGLGAAAGRSRAVMVRDRNLHDRAFQQLDTNRNGQLSRAELQLR